MANELSLLRKRKKDAERKIRALNKEIKSLEKEISDIDKVIAPLEALAAPLKEADDTPTPQSGSGGKRSYSGPKPAIVLAEVERILETAEHPMSRSDLLEILTARGFELKSTNPANALGTAIKRAKETFVSIPRFGYWLVRRDYPAGNHYAATYQPADENEIEPEHVH